MPIMAVLDGDQADGRGIRRGYILVLVHSYIQRAACQPTLDHGDV